MMLLESDFISFFGCRPEKWGPDPETVYGVRGPRWRAGRRWMRGGYYWQIPSSYSCRIGRHYQGRYLDTRKRRAWNAFTASLVRVLDERDATGDATAGTTPGEGR